MDVYIIVATRFQQSLGSTTGPFEVNLSISPPGSPPEQDSSSRLTMLEYGESYEGEITTDIGNSRISI